VTKLRSILDILTTLAILVACAAVVHTNWPLFGARQPRPLPVPTTPQSIDGAAVRGSRAARVAVIEYSDFQCPYCRTFARNTLPELERKYVETGRVLLAFKHLPLGIHPFAQKAAESAECAARQGKFWEMHDRLFEEQQLDNLALLRHANAIGLDAAGFADCLNGEAKSKVQADGAAAAAANLSGTPAFLIGTVTPEGSVKVRRVLSGAQPIEEFSRTLDQVLRETR
jgi:protein-disulfide isomerase